MKTECFTVEVTVEDNAGNVTGPKTVEIYRDNTAATISGFEFSLENNIDVSGENGVYGAVDITDYGFYFKENVTVTINAEDLKAANETASGVGGISYRAINIDRHGAIFRRQCACGRRKCFVQY